MLGVGHIILMVVCFTLVILIGFFLRNISQRKRVIIYRVLAVITLSLDPIYLLWEFLVTGKINVATSLPLYFCSIFILAVTVFAFTKQGSKINLIFRNYLLTMNLLAACFGIFFLVYLNRYPMFHFVVVRSFFYHYLMVLVPCIIYFGDKPKLKLTDSFTFLIPAAFIFIPAFIVDLACGYDYCYFNGGKGTPVSKFTGNMHPALLFFLIILFFLVATNLLVNLPRFIAFKAKIKMLENKNKNQIKNNNI